MDVDNFGTFGYNNGLLVPHLEMKGFGDTVIFPVLHIALGHVMDRLCMASGWQGQWSTESLYLIRLRGASVDQRHDLPL